MTNRKLHTRFRLVPKAMTLNGNYALHCTKHASFGAYNENLNDDRLSASFSQYKFYAHYADMGGSSLDWRGASNDSGVIENADFQRFRMPNFGFNQSINQSINQLFLFQAARPIES